MDCWDFFVKHEAIIKRICKKLAGNDPWLADDLYSEAAIRCPRVWELHSSNESKAIGILHLYMWKYKCSYIKRINSSCEVQDLEYYIDNLNVHSMVNEVREKLDDQYLFNLLYWKDAEEHTFEDIAKALNISKSTARNHYMFALNQARGKPKA